MGKAQETMWLEGYRAVFERADRIVTGTNLRVVLDDSGLSHSVPGWTDGKTIYLSKPMMETKLARGLHTELLLSIKGLNYHEVAHCLFTPRANSKIVRKVKEEGYFKAYNILEDFRAESLFVATFKTARLYFTNTVIQFILAEGNLKDTYPLLAGRKYLPAEIVKPLRKLFAESTTGKIFHGLPIVDALDALANEYVGVTYPRDNDRALGIIEDFYNLLKSLQKAPDSSCNSGNDSTRGRPVSQDEQDAAQENLEIAEEEWEDEEEPDDYDSGDSLDVDSDDEEDSSSSGGETTSDEPDDEDGEDGGNAESQSDKSDTEHLDDTVTGNEDGAGAVNDPASMTEESAIFDALQDLLEDIAASETVAEDLRDTHEAVRSEIRAEVESIPATPAKFQPVPATMNDLISKTSIMKHLRDIQADLSPKWHRQQRAGFIDVNEAIATAHDPNNQDVFESWDAGREDEASTEIVLLLDQSGSMSGPLIQNASRMLWSLREAMRRVGIRVSALGFSDGHTKLYDPEERTSEVKMFGVYGGTQPLYALSEALPVLQRSTAHNKVVVIITDGGWADTSQHRALYHQMDALDVVRVLVRLGNPEYPQGRKQFEYYEGENDTPERRHFCHIVENVLSPLEVAPAVEKLVAHLMEEQGRA